MSIGMTRRGFMGSVAGVGAGSLLGGAALAQGRTTGSAGEAIAVNYAYTDPSFAASGAPYTSLPFENGYFQAENLNVTIIPIPGAMQASQAVSAGDALFAVSGVTAFYPAIIKDPSLRVAGFYSSIYQIAAPEKSNIRTVADLKGKTIGTQTLTSASYYFARMILKDGGLDPDKDVQWLPVGVGNQAAAALRNNDVVALALWDSVIQVVGGLLGTTMVPVSSPLSGLPAMGAFLTRTEALKKQPEVLGRFLRALYKSYVWAQTNPEATIRLHWKHFPLQRPKRASEEVAVAEGVALLKARLPLILPKNINDPIGYVEPELVQRTATLLYDNGILKDLPDIKNLIDQSVSKFANDFDREKVIADAKQWKMK